MSLEKTGHELCNISNDLNELADQLMKKSAALAVLEEVVLSSQVRGSASKIREVISGLKRVTDCKDF